MRSVGGSSGTATLRSLPRHTEISPCRPTSHETSSDRVAGSYGSEGRLSGTRRRVTSTGDINRGGPGRRDLNCQHRPPGPYERPRTSRITPGEPYKGGRYCRAANRVAKPATNGGQPRTATAARRGPGLRRPGRRCGLVMRRSSVRFRQAARPEGPGDPVITDPDLDLHHDRTCRSSHDASSHNALRGHAHRPAELVMKRRLVAPRA
jgi:hypothetical protein